jgi:hypothetical protein
VWWCSRQWRRPWGRVVRGRVVHWPPCALEHVVHEATSCVDRVPRRDRALHWVCCTGCVPGRRLAVVSAGKRCVGVIRACVARLCSSGKRKLRHTPPQPHRRGRLCLRELCERELCERGLCERGLCELAHLESEGV